jgi:hypothetical protein
MCDLAKDAPDAKRTLFRDNGHALARCTSGANLAMDRPEATNLPAVGRGRMRCRRRRQIWDCRRSFEIVLNKRQLGISGSLPTNLSHCFCGHGVAGLVQDDERKPDAVMTTIAIGGASRVSGLWDAKKEADLLRSLRHPNIIQLIDSFEKSRSEFVLVLEYVDALDLQRSSDSYPNIPERAIFHLPSVRMVHRDLKVANIFLFKNRLFKIGGFGISKCCAARSSRRC